MMRIQRGGASSAGGVRLVAALVVAGLLLGCGTPPPAPPATSATKPVDAKPTAATEAKPAAPAAPTGAAAGKPAGAAPKRGGTLIIGNDADPSPLDPPTTTSTSTHRMTSLITETLVGRDLTKGDGQAAPLVPGLAERWELSPDGLTYTFFLRRGVEFHDGTPFNAEAVKLNFDRMMDKESPLYYEKARQAPSFITAWINSIETPDDSTVKVTLKERWGSFLGQMSNLNLGMLSPTALRKEGNEGIGERPVGTGPFKFSSWERGAKVEMVANPTYWGGPPPLDKVIFRAIPEAEARKTALLTGEVDMDIGVQPDNLAQLQADSKLTVVMATPAHMQLMYLNTKEGPLADKRVRQAINHAVNKETLAKDLLKGTAVRANSILPVGNPAYDPNLDPYPYDVERARRLMAEAAASNVAIKVILPTSTASMVAPLQTAQLVQADLRQIGIGVELDVRENNAWLEVIRKGATLEHQALYSGWTTTAGDPFLLEQLFSAKFFPPSGNNRAWYDNPEFDRLLDQARTETDQAKQIALYRQAETLLVTDAPTLSLINALMPIAHSTKVQNFVPPPSLHFSLTEVWIE